MKLYDLLQIKECIDTYDTEYDAIVTVDADVEDNYVEDNYDKFCNYIFHNVEVVDAINDICDWTGFIKNNMTALKEFTKEHWNNTYENDEDEFIYQWINELHLYCAGYTSENVYKAFLDTIQEQKIYNLASRLVNYTQSYTPDFYDSLDNLQMGVETGKTDAETIENMKSHLYDKTFCKAVYDYILGKNEFIYRIIDKLENANKADLLDIAVTERKSELCNELRDYIDTLDEVQLNNEKDIDICE